MEFSPAFYLLTKFSIGLRDSPKTDDDVVAVASYLGVELPDTTLDDKIQILAKELQTQNCVLSTELNSESIEQSVDYRKSIFIREIVTNNRNNSQDR